MAIPIVLFSIFGNRRFPVRVRDETISKRKNIPQCDGKASTPTGVSGRCRVSNEHNALPCRTADPVVSTVEFRQWSRRLCLRQPFRGYAATGAQGKEISHSSFTCQSAHAVLLAVDEVHSGALVSKRRNQGGTVSCHAVMGCVFRRTNAFKQHPHSHKPIGITARWKSRPRPDQRISSVGRNNNAPLDKVNASVMSHADLRRTTGYD